MHPRHVVWITHATLGVIATNPRPVVFHCTAGKGRDRTGGTNTVLLTLLGVPRAAAVEAAFLAGKPAPATPG
ncbi:tyrosine-protein phosphatase [Streptomyces sp. NPDC001315]|uniref:tyrosine-protein phosphatase n=1 Tax=Streptomyces sp. NPDC001315 TaxID=3364562 RepID=UPI00368A0929